MIEVVHLTDPGCPWAWSASPALAVLRWRYGAGLRWRLALIGLTEERGVYERRGYTPSGVARGYRSFSRRFGMPFSLQPRARVPATGRACRAVVAARLTAAEDGDAALRALQLAWFTSGLVLDEDEAIAAAFARFSSLDGPEVVARLDDPEVEAAYQRDRAEARDAAGSAAERQGKTARTDGPERYTAPSLLLSRDGRELVAGGFQPVEAYDVLIANLDPGIERRPAPDGPLAVLEAFSEGVTTQEVAAVLAPPLAPVDRDGTEDVLLALVGTGAAERIPVGDDALWRATA